MCLRVTDKRESGFGKANDRVEAEDLSIGAPSRGRENSPRPLARIPLGMTMTPTFWVSADLHKDYKTHDSSLLHWDPLTGYPL